MEFELADSFCFFQEFVLGCLQEVLNVGAGDHGLFEKFIQHHRNSIFHDGPNQDLDTHTVRSEKELKKGRERVS